MFTIIVLFFFAAFSYYFWGSLYHSLHMLQQNSYFNERFIQWSKKHPRRVAYYLMAGALVTCIGFRYFMPLDAYLALCGLAFALLAIIRKKGRPKKPMVYTWRIKRLLMTISAVCLFAVAVLGFFLRMGFWWELPFQLAFINAMVRLIILIANRMNKPVEKYIAGRFVQDAKRMLAEHPGLKVIGITGSYGKTSTKHLLNQLLDIDYEVLITPESYNTPMGVVRTIREKLTAAHQVFIVEMGAKAPGDIKEICDIVKPSMGILSSIGEMHLDTFHSIGNIIRTKFELAEAVGRDGLMFLNYDNEYIRNKALSQPAVHYGLKNTELGYPLDVWAENIVSGPSGSSFDICFAGGERISCKTKLLGKHNVLNIVAASSVAVALGVESRSLIRSISRLEPVPHRLQLLPQSAKYQIIDDAFNANPEGAKEALDILRGFPGFRVLITPGIVEMGDQEAEANRRLGGQAAHCCDYIIVVGENRSFALKDGAKGAGFCESRIFIAEDIQAALAKAGQLADDLGQEGGPVTLLLENDLPDNFLDDSQGAPYWPNSRRKTG